MQQMFRLIWKKRGEEAERVERNQNYNRWRWLPYYDVYYFVWQYGYAKRNEEKLPELLK